MDFLLKCIHKLDLPIAITVEDVKSNNNFILEVNDKNYKESRTARGWMSWSVGVLFLLISLLTLFLNGSLAVKLIGWSMLGLPGIGCIIYGFTAPLKYLIYDRLNDRITVPRNFRKSVTISFSKGHGVRVFTSVRPGTINQHLTFVSSKEKPRVGGIITELKVDQYWAFTVWYMDKNRPLPPGTAFDPYRQKDFDRRKAEGFPKPLYESEIETPEATPEQQAERERIGGW